MTAALVEYGLFLAKSLTLILLIGVPLIALLHTRGRFHGDGERIEVSDLNDKYRELARVLRQASLPKKAAAKALKQERKRRAKATGEGNRRRLFVIDFHGDIKATEVASLRELITCVLLEAGAGDELLVRLENAGGTLPEHGLAASQLARVRRSQVRLTVAVDKIAASGGYLMACVADRIIAAPFAVVGSIGVLVQLPNFHRLLERRGVDFELHTAGEYKRTLTLFGENSDEDREKVREQLEDTHGLFKDFIREYRPHIELNRVATGEYWHGTQAVQLGLVDVVETSDDYLLGASADAAIYRVAYAVRKRPLERLLSAMHSGLLQVLSGYILAKRPGLG